LTDNAGVIDGTLYFWTHSTKIGIGVVNPGTGVYAYSGDDYASYNLTGGVGTVADSDPDKTPGNPNKPTGKIGAGQGFFATSNTTILGTNEIVFNNSMLSNNCWWDILPELLMTMIMGTMVKLLMEMNL
jgi:hypothetical protein